MDAPIRPVGDGSRVAPPTRERRSGGRGRERAFDLDEFADDDHGSVDEREVVLDPTPPRDRRLRARPVAPPSSDEAGFRLDVRG